jgi:tight adherence protein B
MKDILSLVYFIFMFLLTLGVVYYFVFREQRVQRRINYYLDINKKYKSLKKKKEKSKGESNKVKSFGEFIRGKLSDTKQEKIDQLLKSAGVELNSEQYVLLRWFWASIIAGILYLISGNMILAIPCGIVGYISPKIWLNKKIAKRIQMFNESLPDMISTIIGSLRAGYSFPQALKTVSEECESPVREEIILLLKEMSYGVTVEEALNNLNKRMPSNDLEIMIQAILIQRLVGGNLSTVLETIVKTIRERNALERQVQTLTSQGRLSGRVIGVMPVVIGFVIYLINPEYMVAFFTNTIGRILIAVGVIFGVIGFILINKLTKIEV